MKNMTSALALLATGLTSQSISLVNAQQLEPHFEVGVVYYSTIDGFKPLDKETSQEGGRSNYTAKIKGAHSALRLKTDQTKSFQVCGVDATRFKLYKFKSSGNIRELVIAKINIFLGGSKNVSTESEIPTKVETAKESCYTLTPQTQINDGEFAFSPVGSADAFTFGVGEAKSPK